MTRSLFLLCAFCAAATQAQAQLTINGGSSGTLNFGTIGFGEAFFTLTPGGGTGPYVFDMPGPIAGFRIGNRPDVPNGLAASVTAVLIGDSVTPGVNTGTIRVTDTATNAILSRTVTFTIASVDVFGVFPSNYGIGDTVSFPVEGFGGAPPYSLTLASGSFPAGLSLDSAAGTLSGTLTTAQSPSFSIQVADSIGKTFTRGFGMTVSPLRLLPASPSTPSPRLLPVGTINLVYSYQIGVSGGAGPYNFSIVPGDSLPPGLSMSSSGLIAGTPTQSNPQGTSFSVNVTDSSASPNTVQYRFALAVLPQVPQPLFINTVVFRDFTAGTDNQQDELFAGGGVPPYTYSVPPGSMPEGMILRQGPTMDLGSDPQPALFRSRALASSSFSVAVTVTDSVGNVATRQIAFRITPLGFQYIFLPANNGPTAVFGTLYSQQLVPYGGTPPYTISTSAIPGGLPVTNQGLVSGTPAEIADFCR